jgi:hypothetical protein
MAIFMNVQELEAEVKSLKNQLSELSALKNQVRILQDIEEIKRLRRSYGYYFEHGMGKEVRDLFADGPDVCFNDFGMGSYIGSEKVKSFFEDMELMGRIPGYLHPVVECSPIIDVDQRGETARGRWYGFASYNIPNKPGFTPQRGFWLGVYEDEYVKQNGKWKIKIQNFGMLYCLRNPSFSCETEEQYLQQMQPLHTISEHAKPNGPPHEFNPEFPSGYIIPFHFKHPVTGKESGERERNVVNEKLVKNDDKLDPRKHGFFTA